MPKQMRDGRDNAKPQIERAHPSCSGAAGLSLRFAEHELDMACDIASFLDIFRPHSLMIISSTHVPVRNPFLIICKSCFA